MHILTQSAQCRWSSWVILSACLILPQAGRAEPLASGNSGDQGSNATPPDKSHYHLFNPTPRAFLREMTTDRPDKTESPFTVDAGHFQLEMDLVTFTHDHDTSGGGDTRISSYAIAPVNLKLGLLNNLDLQLMLETWNWVKTEDRQAATTAHQSGFGDVTARLKYNLWGNDGGSTAMALMPFVKFPTSQDHLGNDSVEGGLIIPLSVELPRGWDMGLMTQFNAARDNEETGYHPDFINTVTFGHDIVGKLGGYAEFFSLVSTEKDSDWIGTVDFGLTYGITTNLQLDTGINIGVTESADDLNPFVGISYRY